MLVSASDTANSSDAANPGCFCSSNLRTYSTFSIACLADFMDPGMRTGESRDHCPGLRPYDIDSGQQLV